MLSWQHYMSVGVYTCIHSHTVTTTCSLIPRLSRNMNMYRGESLVSFLRKHDVIKIGPKQKGNVLHVVQPTMLQCSVCMIFNAR